MSKFIEKNFNLAQKTAVELGAGCGFTACQISKTAASNDSRVIATDVDSVVPLIARNITKNGMDERVKAMPLFWGNQEHLSAV